MQSDSPAVTNAENWAWTQIEKSGRADFNFRTSSVPSVNDSADQAWRDSRRTITAAFIERLVKDEVWSSSLRKTGLEIIGAKVVGQFNLELVQVPFWFKMNGCRIENETFWPGTCFAEHLSIFNCVFEKGLFAEAISVKRSLWFNQVTFNGCFPQFSLDLSGCSIAEDLRFSASTFQHSLRLIDARISRHLRFEETSLLGEIPCLEGTITGRDFRINDCHFYNGLDANRCTVGGTFSLENVTVSDAPLRVMTARVAENMIVKNSQFWCGLHADRLKVGINIDLRHNWFAGEYNRFVGVHAGADFYLNDTVCESGFNMNNSKIDRNLHVARSNVDGKDFLIRGAIIGSDFSLMASNFQTPVIGDSLRIGNHLFLTQSNFRFPPDFHSCSVSGGFRMYLGKMPGFSISGGTIVGDLRLDDLEGNPPLWHPGVINQVRVVVRYARVRAIVGNLEAWPSGAGSLDLNGFSYGYIDKIPKNGLFNGDASQASYYTNWLARDVSFNRQPYQQLAATLRSAGSNDVAEEVLYAARERERGKKLNDGQYTRFFGLSVLRWSIAYGLTPRFPKLIACWVSLLTCFGAVVLAFSSKAAERGLFWCLFASLDFLLPIVDLNRQFSDFFGNPAIGGLQDWQIYYFSLHAFVGFLLGSFVVAALAGLTQARK